MRSIRQGSRQGSGPRLSSLPSSFTSNSPSRTASSRRPRSNSRGDLAPVTARACASRRPSLTVGSYKGIVRRHANDIERSGRPLPPGAEGPQGRARLPAAAGEPVLLRAGDDLRRWVRAGLGRAGRRDALVAVARASGRGVPGRGRAPRPARAQAGAGRARHRLLRARPVAPGGRVGRRGRDRSEVPRSRPPVRVGPGPVRRRLAVPAAVHRAQRGGRADPRGVALPARRAGGDPSPPGGRGGAAVAAGPSRGAGASG